ncbi:MAG: hypothetical protein S4CHLAM2_15950 [Chlamydiales bacterium]|nr:hypothetical protein [Chlamydiales bacterium]
MKKLAALFFLFCLFSASTPSRQELSDFYDDFIDEQKEALNCGQGSTPQPPPNPPPPPFQNQLLPIVLVNNSGLPDDQVYVLITGNVEGTSDQVFLDVDGAGIGTLVPAVLGDNGNNYAVTLDQLPETSGGRVIYSPNIAGGVIWFSMEMPLDMPVVAGGIQQPDGTNPGDPNYTTNFDIFEYAYVSTGTEIAADATAVTAFSIPLYGYLSTPDVGSSSNTGLFEPRSTIIERATTLFGQAPLSAQWNTLLLMDGGEVLRIAAPEKAMAAGLMDPNYLDNATDYGYSYIEDIWSSLTSFYRTNPLVITIPDGSGETYTGVINGDDTITFTSDTSGYEVVLSAPTTAGITTTRAIFGGTFFIDSDTSPGMADGIQVNKTLEEAIIVGIVPTADPITLPGLVANQDQYYMVNPNLSPAGQASGPWYSLYSQALHESGLIYTYAFDEALWPQVLMQSSTFIPNQTYIGVTIGNVE